MSSRGSLMHTTIHAPTPGSAAITLRCPYAIIEKMQLHNGATAEDALEATPTLSVLTGAPVIRGCGIEWIQVFLAAHRKC